MLVVAFGGLQAGVSFRVDHKKAIGVVGSTLSLFGSTVSTIGMQGQYHLQDGDVMDDGIILDASAELLFASYDSGLDGFGFMQEDHMGVLATTAVDYQWVYANGLHIRAEPSEKMKVGESNPRIPVGRPTMYQTAAFDRTGACARRQGDEPV